MARMTEEEAWALDDYVTNNKITLGPNGTGFLSQLEMRALGLGDKTVKFVIKKAIEDHKPPAQIIDELVSKEMTASSS